MRLAIPSTLEDSLGFNLDRTATLFRRELLRVLAEDGLQPEQWQVLVTLGESGPQSQQALAALTLADKHALSRMLSRMERDNWVRRLPNPKDARSQLVELTHKAKARKVHILGAVRGHFADLLRPFPDADRKTLLRLLRGLRSTLKDSA